jgi:hypothetical protein
MTEDSFGLIRASFGWDLDYFPVGVKHRYTRTPR